MKCDHIKRMITSTSDNINRFSLYHHLARVRSPISSFCLWLSYEQQNRASVLSIYLFNSLTFTAIVTSFDMVQWLGYLALTQVARVQFLVSEHFLTNDPKTNRLSLYVFQSFFAQKSNLFCLQKMCSYFDFRPHIYNLNFDPQLSARIVHIIQKPETTIGNRKGHESDICMVGPG